jgi:hypothetical protein
MFGGISRALGAAVGKEGEPEVGSHLIKDGKVKEIDITGL